MNDDEVGPPESDALLARRVQILATEHWGLLAARTTTQNEMLARITIFLALLSAGLVTIGLLGQASAFRDWFAPASLAILGFLLVIGIMTQIRVFNAADEDLMFVVAMNRLRAAYVDLDPGVTPYILEATADDLAGMKQTYMFLRRRGDAAQVIGSSAFLIVVVVASVLGLLGGAIVAALGGATGWAIAIGVLLGLCHVGTSALLGARSYRVIWAQYRPLRSSGGPPAHLSGGSRAVD